MIYETPVLRRTGDLSVTVEFGDEISLPVSFRVIALSQLIEADPISGVLETIPTHRSVGIVVNPEELGAAKLEAALKEVINEAAKVERLVSRIVHIPLLYDDPWSRDCARAHGHRNSIDLVAEANEIDPAEVPIRHSSTTYWVGALGFTPGCTQAFPLREESVLVAPKAAVPRKWTYPRIVALGGRLTAPYTVKSPGGYQMLGRTPLDWYDPTRKNPTYGDDIILCRVGDRQRFEPIGLEAYEEVRELVILGRYEYRIELEHFRLDDGD
jgi:urea carboxylase